MSVITVTSTRTLDLNKLADAGRRSYAAFEERLVLQVDPYLELDQPERERRVAMLRSARFRHLAALSAKARKRESSKPTTNSVAINDSGALCSADGHDLGRAAD